MDELEQILQEADAELSLDREETLGSLTELLKRRAVLLGVQARLEESLTSTRAQVREIETVSIPELMDSIGLSKIVADNGATVSVDDIVEIGIKADKKALAFEWLEEHGFGDIIKADVTAKFSKSELEEAKKLAEDLKNHGLDVRAKLDVHYQTMKSIGRQAYEQGVVFPEDIFNVYTGRKAKIK